MSFKITVSFALPGEPDPHPNQSPQFSGLDPERASGGMHAFLRDMLTLKGSAIQSITIEREQPVIEQEVKEP